MTTDITVIVPTKVIDEELATCVESIYRSSQSIPYLNIELLVTTHEASLHCQDSLSFSPKTRLITGGGTYPLNSSKARNLGIANARGDILAFTDADCVVDEDWLEQISKTFSEVRSRGDIVCVLGNHWLDQDYAFWSDLQGRYREHHALEHIYEEEDIRFTDHLDGRNFAISRSVAERFLFDETQITEADRELGFRLVRDGYKIMFNPDMKVRHVPITFADIVKKEFGYGIGSSNWRRRDLQRTFFNYYLKHDYLEHMGETLRGELPLDLLLFTLFNNLVYQAGRTFGTLSKQ